MFFHPARAGWYDYMGKFRPGSAKAGSRLAGMKLFPCNHRIKFMKSLLYCRDPGKAGQNFIPAKWDHVITPLEISADRDAKSAYEIV